MSGLGQISRVKYVLKKELLVTVINLLVFSKLYYCSVVWSNTTDRNINGNFKEYKISRPVLSVELENTIILLPY